MSSHQKWAAAVFFLCLMFGCAQQQKDAEGPPSPTSIFSTYLSAQFNTKIIEELHYYVLIPRHGCTGCMQRSLLTIQAIVNNGHEAAFTYIVSNEKQQIRSIFMQEHQQILIDTTGQLDQLNLGIAHVTVVATEKGRIQEITAISPEQLQVLPSLFSWP
jgi:hypothetical protein